MKDIKVEWVAHESGAVYVDWWVYFDVNAWAGKKLSSGNKIKMLMKILDFETEGKFSKQYWAFYWRCRKAYDNGDFDVMAENFVGQISDVAYKLIKILFKIKRLPSEVLEVESLTEADEVLSLEYFFGDVQIEE